HIFTKTAPGSASREAIAGAYKVMYATTGAVRIDESNGTFKVTVTTPFRFYGATCAVPNESVIATFSGTSPSFTGTASFYEPSTCAFSGSDNAYRMQVNDDGTLTSTYAEASGPHHGESHLFTRA